MGNGCDTVLTNSINIQTADTFIKPIKIIEDISSQHFKKIKKIGSGSFGDVYLIQSKTTKKEYALKSVKIIGDENKDEDKDKTKDENKDEKKLERIMNEVNNLRQIDHPNIICFKGAFKSNKKNILNIITEYADNGDLYKLLSYNSKKNIYFEENQLLDWLIQCSFALSYLHEIEILHRDIKPSNIFLMKDNTIKLGDFGISKDIHIFHYTRTQGAGTPLYMAPEIILKKKYDLKVDVWSLGVTFCHLMTLHFPFELKKNDPDHPDHKYENILNGIKSNKITECNGNYKKEINEKYSQEFLNLIDEMMTIDPQKRPNIGDILNKDIIKKRMSSFLKENKFNSDEANKIIESYEKEKEKEKENMQNYKEFEINEKTQKINIEDSSLENNNDYSELNTLEITPQKENRLKYNFQRILSLVHKEQISRRKTMNN